MNHTGAALRGAAFSCIRAACARGSNFDEHDAGADNPSIQSVAGVSLLMVAEVLVTGGAGFIGSHLTRLLGEQGVGVRVMELPGVLTSHLPAGVELVRGDVANRRDVRRAVAGCGVVLHLAANPNLWAKRPDEFERVNHLGARAVLDEALRAGAERVVHVSTESILASADRRSVVDERCWLSYHDVPGPYCRSKWLAESYALRLAAEGAPVVIASPTVPIGPGAYGGVPMTRLIADFANGRVKANLESDLNLVDVRDAAAGIWAAAQRGRPGARYLLAGENWTTSRLFALLGELLGRPGPRFNVPYPVALAFAYLEECYCRLNGRVPMATVTGVRLTRRSMRFDASASLGELGIEPRPIRPAIRETVDWLAARGLIRR